MVLINHQKTNRKYFLELFFLTINIFIFCLKTQDTSNEEEQNGGSNELKKKLQDFEDSATPSKKKIRQCDV